MDRDRDWAGLIDRNVLYNLLLKVLRRWRQVDDEVHQHLAEMLVLIQLEAAKDEGGEETAVQRVLLTGMEAMQSAYPEEITIVRRRFLFDKSMGELEQDLAQSRDNLNRKQRQGIDALVLWLLREEAAIRKAQTQTLLNQLPAATYTTLFGQSEVVAEIVARLLADEAGLLAIIGLGGSGKTALVDAVAREAILQGGQNGRFAGIVWVRIKSSTMSGKRVPEQSWQQICDDAAQQLQIQMGLGQTILNMPEQFVRQHLQQKRWLVVVDNIEEEHEAAHLLTCLQDWVNPSLVVITSRVRPQLPAPVWLYQVPALGEADSIGLLRYEAERIGLHEVAAADRAQLAPIWRLTGGNPLALKLVIGLAVDMPLPTIVADLKVAQLQETSQMYTQIYRKVWQSLSKNSRELLEAMPLIGEQGGTVEQMQAISGLVEERPFWAAVRELAGRSLLEVRGDAWERRYGIHGLTESFLRSEIIRWFEEE